jgi:hypothetical protein
MSLRDELEPPRSNGGKCSVDEFLNVQPDRAEWDELLSDSTIQHSQIYRLLKKHGFPLTDQPVGRHRKGECACRAKSA